MIVAESRRGRRIVGRLDRGVDLLDALTSVCKQRGVRAGELRALGSLETVEVSEYDQQARGWKPSRRFGAGGFEILNLTGNVSERDGQLALHAHITLMRDRDNGVEILGGHLLGAKVFALEFVIETWDDVVLRRAADPHTGLVLWNEALELAGPEAERAPAAAPTPAALPTPSPPAVAPPSSTRPLDGPAPRPGATPPSNAAPSWAEVAAASHGKPTSRAVEDEDHDDSLQPGDVLVHPTFGRCEVQRIEGSYEFAHIRLRNGRLVRLSLDVIKVFPAGNEDGKRVFRARVSG